MERAFVHSKYVKELLFRLKKWDKLIVISVSLLIFFIIMCTVIVVVETYCQYSGSATESKDNTTVPVDKYTGSESNNCFLENTIECTVQCNNMNADNMSSAVNVLNLSECNPQEINLILNEVYFTDNTITTGWLKSLSRDVKQITITSSLLTDIGDSAFSGKPFENLQTLEFAHSRIKYLRKDSFKGLRIDTFEFRCLSHANVEIEFNALEYISDYLVILQFNQCIDDFEAIRNITGTKDSIFNQLLEMDLSYNSFTNILNNSFVNAPQIRSLYLFSNNLKTIEVNAFHGIGSSLQLLSLKSNKLRTLPDGVFQGFTKGGEIDISNNPWECDCDLVWFKDFYTQHIEMYFQKGAIPFVCTTGNYLDVEFCAIDENSTTKTVTTSTSATAITVPATESPDGYLYLNCIDIQNNLLEDSLNRVYSHTVQVRNGTITYKFYQVKNTPYFEIKLHNSIANNHLIWINSKNSSDYGCINNIKETVLLSDLNYGSTYTICLLKEGEETVTPFDCTSLTVPMEWKNGPWIINKYMPAVIGGIVGISIAIIVITTVITFYTIRQHPKLIKGNKRVVIVRNKSTDALVMPNYEKQEYVPPSIYTNSEGYLTPRSKMYEKIHERQFEPLNTITEKFYQDYQNSNRSTTNYAGFLHRKSMASDVYATPPLPPNHPSERASGSSEATSYRNKYKNWM